MSTRSTTSTLVGLIGIDYTLLKSSSEKNIDRFIWAAGCVILILILSFISVYYAFELMFHIWYMQIFLSLFFSLMFATIYVLLIQTFSKQALSGKEKWTLNLSNMLRALFILFIGFLIAKPLEIMFLSRPLEKDIAIYKSDLQKHFEKGVHKLHAEDLRKLQSKLAYFKEMAGTMTAKDIQVVQNDIDAVQQQEENERSGAAARIGASEFFLQRVSIATNKYPLSWIVCLVVIVLFTIPAFLVYTISSNSRYYTMKRDIEKYLVQEQYNEFTILYSATFKKQFDIDNIVYYETHTDPPFRTQKIPVQQYSSQDEFIKPFL